MDIKPVIIRSTEIAAYGQLSMARVIATDRDRLLLATFITRTWNILYKIPIDIVRYWFIFFSISTLKSYPQRGIHIFQYNILFYYLFAFWDKIFKIIFYRKNV